MLVPTTASDLPKGCTFHHHLNTYFVCDEQDEGRHPACGQDGVLAYHVPARGPRVPVRFSDHCTVFVKVAQ